MKKCKFCMSPECTEYYDYFSRIVFLFHNFKGVYSRYTQTILDLILYFSGGHPPRYSLILRLNNYFI